MNFHGAQTLEFSRRLLGLVQTVGVSVALTAAAMGGMGAFDVTAPIAAPPELEHDDLSDRDEPTPSGLSAVFYVVNSQVEALALEAAIAHDWPALDPDSQANLRVGVFANETPESEALIETLTAMDWVAELGGFHVAVIDLREASINRNASVKAP